MAAPPEAGSTQDMARPAEEVYGATMAAKPLYPQKVMGMLTPIPLTTPSTQSTSRAFLHTMPSRVRPPLRASASSAEFVPGQTPVRMGLQGSRDSRTADDIFVFMDAWRQSEHVGPDAM